MRWKAKKRPQRGDNRTITKFLFIPRCVNGLWRWLETASIRQERVRGGFWADRTWADVTKEIS